MDLLQCPIQRYPWGSTTAIPALLGIDPDGAPQAELWAGAHPSAPSMASGRPLSEIIAAEPLAALGPEVLKRFGSTLPFLAKILAAAEPLSIQAHPDLSRARQGFAQDEAEGLAIDAPRRRYKDQNHKPEILVALTPFHALAGIRHLDETMGLLEELDLAGLPPFDGLLANGAASVVAALLDDSARGTGVPERVAEAASGLVAADHASRTGPPDAAGDPVMAVAWWVDRIASMHPGDPGVGVALLLNLVDLAPGEAINLRAGNLHAYLEGTGVEVMASSDNVLRGGLTSKHVDVPELLAVLDATPGRPPVVKPVTDGRIVRWPTPDPDFAVSMVEAGATPVELAGMGPRIAIVVDGAVTVEAAGKALEMPAGSVVWVPAADGTLGVEGEGRLFVATVGA